MKWIVAFFRSSLITVILVTLIGFLLPTHYEVQREITLQAPSQTVWTTLTDLTTWPSWSLWSERFDPTIQYRYGEKRVGEGALQVWRGDRLGEGRISLVKARDGELSYEVSMETGEFNAQGNILVKEAEGKTQIVWVERGTFGENPLGRYLGLFMDPLYGPDLEKALGELDQVALGVKAPSNVEVARQ